MLNQQFSEVFQQRIRQRAQRQRHAFARADLQRASLRRRDLQGDQRIPAARRIRGHLQHGAAGLLQIIGREHLCADF